MKKALVYNRYLKTAGGGERATIDLCLALEQLDYKITVITSSDFQSSIENLCKVFGLTPKHNWDLLYSDSEEEISLICKEQKFDVFVNYTFCSSMPNPAPLGIYSVMFPQRISESDKKLLATYQIVLTISEFTNTYLKLYWGVDFKTHCLIPPISDSHIKNTFANFSDKEKVILTVGRFNTDGHSKRQLDGIRFFNKLRSFGFISNDWKYYLVGNLNDGEENKRYFEQCKSEAGPNIFIESDVSFEELKSLYKRASILWQLTGINLRNGHLPQHCEHLGLVALDAMCYGAIPMVYQRSGVGYIIDHAITGFSFDTTDELKKTMQLFDSFYGSSSHEKMFNDAKNAALNYSFSNYTINLSNLINN
jgi:glycosyltransferase involved in cell wall biosynthesis